MNKVRHLSKQPLHSTLATVSVVAAATWFLLKTMDTANLMHVMLTDRYSVSIKGVAAVYSW